MTTDERAIDPAVRLGEIEVIGDEYERAAALAAIAPQLPEDLFSPAVQIITTTEPSSPRLDAIVALAPNLPPNLLFDLFGYLRDTKDDPAMLALFPIILRALQEFPEDLGSRVLTQALSVGKGVAARLCK